MTEWISVKKRLPDFERVVFVSNGGIIGCAWLSFKKEWLGTHGDNIFGWDNMASPFTDTMLFRVTHWMELPESPKEKE